MIRTFKLEFQHQDVIGCPDKLFSSLIGENPRVREDEIGNCSCSKKEAEFFYAVLIFRTSNA